MRPLIIERGSPAFRALAEYLASPELYRLSIEDRTADPQRPGVAVKFNENVWTPTLGVTA